MRQMIRATLNTVVHAHNLIHEIEGIKPECRLHPDLMAQTKKLRHWCGETLKEIERIRGKE